MDGWKNWIGKKVFLRLRSNKVYSGIVTDVSDEKNGICFFKIKDKFNMDVMFVNSEILEIKEEH